MHRWIAWICVTLLVVSVMGTLIGAGWAGDEEIGSDDKPAFNGVTPTAPPTPSFTPTSVATPVPE